MTKPTAGPTRSWRQLTLTVRFLKREGQVIIKKCIASKHLPNDLVRGSGCRILVHVRRSVSVVGVRQFAVVSLGRQQHTSARAAGRPVPAQGSEGKQLGQSIHSVTQTKERGVRVSEFLCRNAHEILKRDRDCGVHVGSAVWHPVWHRCCSRRRRC